MRPLLIVFLLCSALPAYCLPKAVLLEDPPVLKAGQTGKLKLSLDTKGMPKGEVLIIVSLTTNSPLRPLVNLFITGFIQ